MTGSVCPSYGHTKECSTEHQRLSSPRRGFDWDCFEGIFEIFLDDEYFPGRPPVHDGANDVSWLCPGRREAMLRKCLKWLHSHVVWVTEPDVSLVRIIDTGPGRGRAVVDNSDSLIILPCEYDKNN